MDKWLLQRFFGAPTTPGLADPEAVDKQSQLLAAYQQELTQKAEQARRVAVEHRRNGRDPLAAKLMRYALETERHLEGVTDVLLNVQRALDRVQSAEMHQVAGAALKSAAAALKQAAAQLAVDDVQVTQLELDEAVRNVDNVARQLGRTTPAMRRQLPSDAEVEAELAAYDDSASSEEEEEAARQPPAQVSLL